jgi:2-polyprenyl-6-methoxyphenol hydroxylase-like FAD-dependent oxidoreductase
MARTLIVGAGPAGAALAVLLARRGVEVALLERHVDFAREFRGEALMPSGVDALRQMGITLDGVPQVPLEVLEVYRGARRLLRVDATALGVTGPRIVSQPALLERLVAEAARAPSFRLERGVAVRDLVWEGGRVVGVRADEREWRADLVIGADGRASVVRARAGLAAEGSPQAFDVVWGKVPLPAFLAGRPTARAYFGRGHAALVFPAADGRLQVGWIIAKGSFGELRRRGMEAWIADMAGHVSPDLAAHLRAHATDVTHPFLLDVRCERLARWSRPGLLLLGDAAHPMSPVGGQGINIALRDALVAANHLGAALGGGASAAAVDLAAERVQSERLPEVIDIQGLQRAAPRVLFGPSRVRAFVFDRLLPFLVRTGLAARVAGAVFDRFANGVARVRLEA